METQLRHSLKDGSTWLRGRLKLSTPSDTVSRTYVGLNTTKSRLDIDGYLRQFWCFLGRKHGPIDNRLRLGLGAHYMFGSGLRERLFVGPVIKKEFHFQPRHASQALSANLACVCEWDTAQFKARKPLVEGRALLNYKVMRFMKRQDVKLTAGSRIFWSGDRLASFKLAPVLRVRENNWSALLEFDDPRRYLGSVLSSSTAKRPAPKLTSTSIRARDNICMDRAFMQGWIELFYKR